MNKLPILASALLLSVSLSVQASPATDAITDAKMSMKKVNAVGYLWRDTGKILKKAEAAAAKGDDKTAVKMARRAEEQAKDAYAQYERYYKDAGPRF
jgi:hypothetical protein